MLRNQITAPLLAMSAAFVMSVLLSACKTSHASNQSSDFYSDTESITIHRNHGQAIYHVNGKSFTYEQLSDSQKKDILKMEKNLEKLEMAIEIDSKAMEKWAEKMELVAEKMEDEVEQLEDVLENIEFDVHSFKPSDITKKIEITTKKMGSKMKILEAKLKAMEFNMPRIDSAKIKAIEKQAEKYKDLLIEISKTI